jgi:hypothetical protein
MTATAQTSSLFWTAALAFSTLLIAALASPLLSTAAQIVA